METVERGREIRWLNEAAFAAAAFAECVRCVCASAAFAAEAEAEAAVYN